MSPTDSLPDLPGLKSPFPALTTRHVLEDVAVGIAAAAGVWLVVWLIFPSQPGLVGPIALAGHVLAGALCSRELRNLRAARAMRAALPWMRVPDEPSPSRSTYALHNGQAATASAAGGTPLTDGTLWKLAFEECRHHPNDYSSRELPTLFDHVGRSWRQELPLQCALVLMLSSLVVFLGMFQGLDSLRLSQPGAYLAGFTSVFAPLIVSTVEGLACGILAWTARIAWDQTIVAWGQAANQLVWEEQERQRVARVKEAELAAAEAARAEQAARPDRAEEIWDVPRQQRQEGVLIARATTDANPGHGQALPQSRNGERQRVDPPVVLSQDKAADDAPAASDSPWGSLNTDEGGVRVKVRKDLDVS